MPDAPTNYGIVIIEGFGTIYCDHIDIVGHCTFCDEEIHWCDYDGLRRELMDALNSYDPAKLPAKIPQQLKRSYGILHRCNLPPATQTFHRVVHVYFEIIHWEEGIYIIDKIEPSPTGTDRLLYHAANNNR